MKSSIAALTFCAVTQTTAEMSLKIEIDIEYFGQLGPLDRVERALRGEPEVLGALGEGGAPHVGYLTPALTVTETVPSSGERASGTACMESPRICFAPENKPRSLHWPPVTVMAQWRVDRHPSLTAEYTHVSSATSYERQARTRISTMSQRELPYKF